MKYKLVIFDMDGTILDTLEDLRDSLNFALKQMNMPERSIDEVRQFVGNGIRKLIERGVPEGTDQKRTDAVYRIFTEHYTVHCNDHTKAYPGVVSCMQELKKRGVLLAVVSNKADYAVQELCNLHFKGIFDYAVGEREGIRRKPEPDSVNEVLNRLHVSRREAVYVGDSDVDIATARNAGLNCISVSWGFRSVEFLQEHQASRIVHDTGELMTVLMS